MFPKTLAELLYPNHGKGLVSLFSFRFLYTVGNVKRQEHYE